MIFLRNIFLSLFIICAIGMQSGAQKYDCIFKDAVFKIDFGTDKNPKDIDLDYLPNYSRVFHSCPLDGHYSYYSYTSRCHGGDWFTLNEDHTPGDDEGKMMLVNAYEGGGIFFTATINGLKENTRYEFSACMMNLCHLGGNCTPLPPNILIQLKTPTGRLVAQFQTGQLTQGYEPDWKKYAGFFGTGVKETTLLLTMDDITLGGCGNDFALDDIIIRECITPQPPVTEKPKPVTKEEKKTQTTPTPIIKKEPVKQPVAKTKDRVPVIEKSKPDTLINTKILPKQKAVIIVSVPQILLSRTNPVIKQFSVDAGELQINLYDNGEIDGDTVSVYHNNELIVSKARLSQKPISFKFSIDADHPHHELIMVANNLGSIPPNTSVMIITVNEKRYQVFISSTEQKNAMVVFDLKN